MLKRLCCFLFLLISLKSFAQKNVTTVGIQYKPIFPVSFLGSGNITSTYQNVTIVNGLNSGYSAGLIIRKGISDLISIETGINYVRRKYDLEISDGNFNGSSSYRVISYEIPVTFMVYARMFENIYMNGSLGPSVNMYPSNLATYDYYFTHVALRNHIIIPAVTANLGWEFRTEKSGYIYLGASFQRPFQYIFTSQVNYKYRGKDFILAERLSGSYLTIDLRYYFHEEAKKPVR